MTDPAALGGVARDLLGRLAHVGIAVANGAGESFGTAAAPGLPPLGADDPIRVASITKIVTGQVVLDALGAEALVTIGGRQVSVGDLLGHCSGLSDDGGYALGPGGTLEDLAARAVWQAPGFRYCNLGYLLAAGAVPDFRARAGDWLRRHGVPGGLNWDGTDAAFRARAVPCLRPTTAGFAPQIDVSPAVPGPGGAETLSPQGGLRTTLRGCLALGRAIPAMDRRVLHSPGAPRPSALFDQYGAGLMFLRRPSFYPRPLVGHFASAYGVVGGVWHDVDAGISFAYLLNGMSEAGPDDALRPEEHAVFAAIAALGG